MRNFTDARLAKWKAELDSGTEVWTHGLWTWNWADSHRQVRAINVAGVGAVDDATIVVEPDDINRDVNPIRPHISKQQGGYLYAYNLRSELDVAGEYFITYFGRINVG